MQNRSHTGISGWPPDIQDVAAYAEQLLLHDLAHLGCRDEAYGRHDVPLGVVHQDQNLCHPHQGEERASSIGPKGLPEPHPAVPRRRGLKVALRCVQQYAAPIDSPSLPPWVH